jgi:tetratricopeptide (TPR) repeat protein
MWLVSESLSCDRCICADNFRYFQERGYTPEAMECFQIAQTNVEEIIDANQGEDLFSEIQAKDGVSAYYILAECHRNIAGSAVECNDADTALHNFKLYNKILIDQHTQDARLTVSFFDTGLSYIMKGQNDIAITWLEQALKEAERLPDAKKARLTSSLALINLGLTRWLKGENEEASNILERALKDREDLLGPNDRQSMM